MGSRMLRSQACPCVNSFFRIGYFPQPVEAVMVNKSPNKLFINLMSIGEEALSDEEMGTVKKDDVQALRRHPAGKAGVLVGLGAAILLALVRFQVGPVFQSAGIESRGGQDKSIQRKLTENSYLAHVTFSGCGESEIEMIEAAHLKAVEQVRNALDKLPGGRHENFNYDEKYWFGGKVDKDVLKKGFQRLEIALTQEGLIYSCKPAEVCNSDIQAYMWKGRVGDENEPNVALCSSWFGTSMTTDRKYPREPDGIDRNRDSNADPGKVWNTDIGKESRSGIIIHELTHNFHNFDWPNRANREAVASWLSSTTDHHYGDESAMLFRSDELHNFAREQSDKAMENAASWQAFADTGPCWEDGDLCGLGTTCKVCCDKATWWGTKAMTACGKEPQWKDGARCAMGTTCKRCQNKASYWHSKLFTACGSERCLPKGRKCAKGTSCKRCCNGSKYKWKKAMAFCK